jgi:hypothetical protein
MQIAATDAAMKVVCVDDRSVRVTMAVVVHKVPNMKRATVELPIGAELQRQIEEIEARTTDERIRQKIAARVALANGHAAVFASHDEVFAESRARLMARLAGWQGDCVGRRLSG